MPAGTHRHAAQHFRQKKRHGFRYAVPEHRAAHRPPHSVAKHARTQHSNIFSITYYSIVFVDDVLFREVLLVVCVYTHTHTHTDGPWGWRLPGVTPYCK